MTFHPRYSRISRGTIFSFAILMLFQREQADGLASSPRKSIVLKSVLPSPKISTTQPRESDSIDRNSRRSFLVGLSGSVALAYGGPCGSAVAAAPISRTEADTGAARAWRAIRSKPPKLLRPKLDKDFAVLLMRSSYNSLDELDCVAMDQFQRDFFILRQAEYQPYVDSLGAGFVSQGELSDPYYFDFISFAQYLAINREITQDPPIVFSEQQPVKVGDDQPQRFESVVIRRDPRITNAMLASELDRRVGQAILIRLDEIFGESDSRLPVVTEGSRPDSGIVLASLCQLVKLFLVNGFAWDGSASLVSSGSNPISAGGSTFCLKLVSPATIWGAQALALQRTKVANTFLLKTTVELLERMGYRISSKSVKYEGTSELNFVTII